MERRTAALARKIDKIKLSGLILETEQTLGLKMQLEASRQSAGQNQLLQLPELGCRFELSRWPTYR